jgi:hypothetical protein
MSRPYYQLDINSICVPKEKKTLYEAINRTCS